jgi:hypothetical protein
LIWFAVLVLPRWGRALIVEREEGIQANAQLCRARAQEWLQSIVAELLNYF